MRPLSRPRPIPRAALQVELLEDRIAPTVSGPQPTLPEADGLLVRFAAGVPATPPAGVKVNRIAPVADDIYRVYLHKKQDVTAALLAYQADPHVRFAELNGVIRIQATPNDARFDDLVGLNNTGQDGGTPDADIDAPEAWDITTGSLSTVVGVIDTGIDYRHRDLYLNVWINQNEIPAGLRSRLNDTDDDGLITFYDLNASANRGKVGDFNANGYIDGGDLLDNRSGWEDGRDNDANDYRDDLIGWDFINDDNNPFDDHSHGTHVSGTIGASGDNRIGVAGVNWKVQLAGLKFIDRFGFGTDADAIEAIRYSAAMGFDATNNSWGGGFSQALYDAVAATTEAGQVFVAAAGNSFGFSLSYPAAFDLPNILSVAATDSDDFLAFFSNFSATAVDLGAPGVGILSTVPGNRYDFFDGTSMSTPHVAGVVALLRSQHPDWSAARIIDRILDTVDPLASLAGRTVSGGRLNAATALGPDLIGPRIKNHAPRNSSSAVSSLVVTFNEPINVDTFTIEDVVSITGPDNSVIEPLTVEVVADSEDRQFRITFAEQSTLGRYTAIIGPDIFDLAETPHAMDQDRDGANGEETDDRYTAVFRLTNERTFTSADVPISIRDHSTSFSEVTIDEDLSIASLKVQVNLTHTYDSDLIVFLVGPNGSVVSGDFVVLASRNGGSGDNFEDTVFDDGAAVPIGLGAPPYRGSFRPVQPLSNFAGTNARGTWQLWVQDSVGADEGILHSWSLIVRPGGSNSAPVAVAEPTQETMAGQAITVTVLDNDSDPDDDELRVFLVGNFEGGRATANADGTVTFTPDVGFSGMGGFRYTITDGRGGTDSAQVSVMVAPIPVAPIAVDDRTEAFRDTPLVFDGERGNPPPLQANDEDDNDDELLVTWVGNAVHGAVTLSPEGVVTFTPEPGYLGAASFEYEVSDGGLTDRATVHLSVVGSYYLSFASQTTLPGGGRGTNRTNNRDMPTPGGTGGSRVSFAPADIVQLVIGAGGAYHYERFFDGSDVGLTRRGEDIDAFCFLPDGSILISTRGDYAVEGAAGRLEGGGEDLLQFTPTRLGNRTQGEWRLFLDGSAVGLNGNIDAVARSADGQLLISTSESVTVNGIAAADVDLLAFLPSDPSGSWSLYLDGSDVGLSDNSNDDIDAVFVRPENGVVNFSTRGRFEVSGVSGGKEDVLTYTPTTSGETSSGAFGSDLELDGSRYGLAGFDIDGLHIGRYIDAVFESGSGS